MIIRGGGIILGLFLTLLVLAVNAWGNGKEPYGIVSMKITVQEFNYAAPWNKKPEKLILANALVLEEGLLLATADVVKNATLIEVRKFGQYPDYEARPLLIDYEVDMAILEVKDPDFWKGLKALSISEKPVSQGRFAINRWRPNGRFEQGSGEVIEMVVASSRFGNMEFPELRGNTAMSGLGWSEIVTRDGDVFGIITGHNNNNFQASNSPLMKRFVEVAKKKKGKRFAHRGFSWQKLNHPALRQAHNLENDQSGVLIRKIYAGGTGSEELKIGDILIQLGDHEINPEGSINHQLYGPALFTLALNESLEESIPARIIRDGKTLKIDLIRKSMSEQDYRVIPYHFGKPIDFELFGGMVIQELSLGFLKLWGGEWNEKAPSRLVMEYYLNMLREKGKAPEKVVFVSNILRDPSNLGYDEVEHSILIKANGITLNSLEDFRNALKRPKKGYHILDVLPGQGRGEMVFNAKTIDEANKRIRSRYRIP